MTLYDRVRAKIIEAVPEIMELKFGCEVKMTDKGNETLPREFMFVDGIVGKDYKVWRGENYVKVAQMHDWIEKGYYKILGRPITLEDVLMAMLPKYGEYVLEFSGIETCSLEAARVVRKWHLGKPLSAQDNTVIEFLNSILCE